MNTTPQIAIWVDADACPRAIRELIVRAAVRTQLPACFVANHLVPLPRTPFAIALNAPQGADAADALIAERVQPGALVITADLPLASDVLKKGALVLTHRGEPLTLDNIGPRLNMRDFMETMRASGEHHGGAKPLGPRDIQQFANAFDRQLARLPRPTRS
ncbi:YaiI/YqxD family protein [Zymobacter palmae]|uniref:UPF0178 protein ZBT109_0871 n=1 Tax=Zymobacter palmae TaxID=33074 RepID=A0A348HDE2_9GAMM|nr:YaiI/YqxD family protein [Zymobacter palmae]BBG29644.1 uncharacterized protein conserved in bacteria [Zymobacter palmae]